MFASPTKDRRPSSDGSEWRHIARTVAYCASTDPSFPVPESASGVDQGLDQGCSDVQADSTQLKQACDSPPEKQAEPPSESSVDKWWNKVLRLQAVLPYSSTAVPSHKPPGLQARLQHKKQSKFKGSKCPAFDLRTINNRLGSFTQQNATDCLELPRYTGKAQKREVKALAALYGAEPRACGRTGITLFKTSHTCLPDEYKQQQVNNLLANSTATQNTQPAAHSAGVKKKRSCSIAKKHKHRNLGGYQLRQSSHDAEQGPATGHIHAPALDSSNIGSKMLVSMGWEAGTGLGSAMQGQVEPVPIIKRRKLLGLGA